MLTREYAWIDDRVVAVLADANAASPQMYWVTNDHLGRPVQMTDSSQAVVWRAAYRPFGEVISVTGPASLDARFPGQWFQLESGLAYNWHRHYDASIGRYTQADPLGVKAGPSVYGYAGGNPVMGVDPEGLYSPGARIFLWWLKDRLLSPQATPDGEYAGDASTTCKVPSDNGSGRWQCLASCNVQQISPSAFCPPRVTGGARGTSEAGACVAAKRVATQSTPAGCYPRHCQCRCTKG